MRHVLIAAVVFGLGFAYCTAAQAACDPNVTKCNHRQAWQNQKPESKELEQAKLELEARRKSASQDTKLYLENRRKAREAVVQGKK